MDCVNRPCGTNAHSIRVPNVETLGYSQTSLPGQRFGVIYPTDLLPSIPSDIGRLRSPETPLRAAAKAAVGLTTISVLVNLAGI